MLGPDQRSLPELVDAASHTYCMTKPAKCRKPSRMKLSSYVRKPSYIRGMIVTRFAPSPTGFLHLGHVYAAAQAWHRARRAGGFFHLRVEDIDATRCRPAFAAAICEDLAWLGLDWDGDIRVQSDHFADYQTALNSLAARGLTYPCFCTRADIARAISAPHGAPAVYPGTCRNLSRPEQNHRIAARQPYATRLNVNLALHGAPAQTFHDETAGWITANPAKFGDIVLARRDTPASYHLCVVKDDALQGVTLVTRGIDLLGSTHIQVLLQHLLGLPTPAYAHHVLLTDAAGQRLAKRENAPSIRSMREAGVSPASVFARMVENIVA
jgi:glutamyl-Q tRNA(Asp) synthetase